MNNLYKSFLTLIILPSIFFAQTSGGGIAGGGGAIGGGQSNAVMKKEITSVFNKKLLSGLGQRIAKPVNQNKTTTGKKTVVKTKPSNSKNPSTVTKTSPSPMANNTTAINFKPINETGTDKELAAMLSSKPDEQLIFLTIFSETKKAYNLEARKLNRENDIALSTTFFIASCLTVYNQTEEPSDAATESLYSSLADEMLSSEETSQMSNFEKQVASEKLVYIAGLILMGYLFGKQSNDRSTMEAFRQAAAVCFQSFTNLNIVDYYFDKNGLKSRS